MMMMMIGHLWDPNAPKDSDQKVKLVITGEHLITLLWTKTLIKRMFNLHHGSSF